MNELQEIVKKLQAMIGKLSPANEQAVDNAAVAAHQALLGGHAAKTVDMAGDKPMTKDVMEMPPPMMSDEAEDSSGIAALADAIAQLEARVAALESGTAKIAEFRTTDEARFAALEGKAQELPARIAALEEAQKGFALQDEISVLTKTAEQLSADIRQLAELAAGVEAKQGQRSVTETPAMVQILSEDKAAGAIFDAPPVFKFTR